MGVEADPLARLTASIVLLAALTWPGASGAQPMPLGADGKLFDLAKVKKPSCDDGAIRSDEILVCGRNESDTYRVPGSRGSGGDGTSWTARSREMMERSIFDGQTVGPGGAYLHSRQVDYEWRQERKAVARSRRALEREIRRSSRR